MTLIDKQLSLPKLGNGNWEQLRTALNRYCLSLTESHWDAEDLAQDTWLKAVSTTRSADHNNLEAYLLRIAKNTWIDHTRRNATLTRIVKAQQPRVVSPEQGSFELEAAFHSLIKRLSPLQRAVFMLRDVLGYSISETATMLEATEGGVKAALHRARKALDLVREDIEQGRLPLPEDEGLKTFLRILAAAYQTGNVAALIELVQRNEIEPSMAIGILHSRKLAGLPLTKHADIRMAA
ncbi:RNA polymerase sigma factor [Cohnella abietis]|uniref:RNA polymerase sigma factor n=1 Tax=Cohnella abietis TaxID=2507935 RepID=A0A3T1D0K3_9BACL|nr:RNA polymerase sigma factor [Cohnella abietis]BBI31626.1 hypothetical protein KCTCHS21_10250 [Cohnella abietis]